MTKFQKYSEMVAFNEVTTRFSIEAQRGLIMLAKEHLKKTHDSNKKILFSEASGYIPILDAALNEIDSYKPASVSWSKFVNGLKDFWGGFIAEKQAEENFFPASINNNNTRAGIITGFVVDRIYGK